MHEHDMSRGELTEHEFDGIREYDNPTPGWWHLMFWGSILFAFLYIIFFTGELGWTPQSQHERAKARYFEKLFGQLGQLDPTQDTMLTLMTEDKWLTVGQNIFAANCAQCHMADGSGQTGPNLTDDYYINIKKLTDIYHVVTNGVVAKGMPTWANRLNENQRIIVATYVASLRGKNLPGKAPEPESKKIEAWPAAPPSAGEAAAQANAGG